MSLRNRLLALSLLTFLLPWSGWKLLQELESFLREAQESALLSSARTLAGSLPFESQSQLLYAPERYLVLRSLDHDLVLDGFSDDWPDPGQGFELASGDGRETVLLLAGKRDSGLFLHFDVKTHPGSAGNAPAPKGLSASISGAAIEVLLRSPRGLVRFDFRPEAPGPLKLSSEGGEGQAEGFWLDTADGYRVELSVPGVGALTDLGFTVSGLSTLGTRQSDGAHQWLNLVAEWRELSETLSGAVPEATRAWLVNQNGWILADSGPAREREGKLEGESEREGQQTTWAQRLLYRVVAGGRTRIETSAPEHRVRLQSPEVMMALTGEEGRAWAQDADTAVVRNTVAVPVRVQGDTRGALVLQSNSEGLLLVTNRALGRLLMTTLVITFGLAGGLWFFATRLSHRVRRLSGAVSAAMPNTARKNTAGVETLPLVSDRDELGELARNNARLLKAVAEYSQYLQTLAGRLSHELKTPLAITRSSLDNLSSSPLDASAREYLQRAQEGVERQAAIVRAMSEANRLEAAIAVADWERVDLVDLLQKCAAAYRDAYPGRKIETSLPEGSAFVRCAPELLSQALDKLVDNAMSLSADSDEVRINLKESESHWLVGVQNTGSQLPAEFQERIFDSLVSVRDKRGETPHLGLGLYIVRLVASAHGGRVTARNLPAEAGVEFLIHLPRLPASAR